MLLTQSVDLVNYCKHAELMSRVGKHPQRQFTELGFGRKQEAKRRREDYTSSLYLQDDTFIALVSMPKSFDTVQETVRFAVGTTVILCVIFPLTKGPSSS